MVCPVTITEAKAFVSKHHRHNRAPLSALFAVGVSEGEDLIGVAIVGRPVARGLDDGRTVEVTRLCTTGTRNACSMLYGAAWRAAQALGYHRAVTYTLASEPGASLKASGWKRDAELEARPTWSSKSRLRVQTDLFGVPTRPAEPKVRWLKQGGEVQP